MKTGDVETPGPVENRRYGRFGWRSFEVIERVVGGEEAGAVGHVRGVVVVVGVTVAQGFSVAVAKAYISAFEMTEALGAGVAPAETRIAGIGPRGAHELVGSKNKDGSDKTIAGVIEALPRLANLVNKRLDELAEERIKSNDLTACDDYQTILAALRQINATVKSYLDIDVTIKPEDFKELVKSIHELR